MQLHEFWTKISLGVHDHDLLIDVVHFPGGKMQISLKLERCRAIQEEQIRN